MGTLLKTMTTLTTLSLANRADSFNDDELTKMALDIMKDLSNKPNLDPLDSYQTMLETFDVIDDDDLASPSLRTMQTDDTKSNELELCHPKSIVHNRQLSDHELAIGSRGYDIFQFADNSKPKNTLAQKNKKIEPKMEHISIPSMTKSTRTKTYSYSPRSIKSYSPSATKSSTTHSAASSPQYLNLTSAISTDTDIDHESPQHSMDLSANGSIIVTPLQMQRGGKHGSVKQHKSSSIPDFGDDDDEIVSVNLVQIEKSKQRKSKRRRFRKVERSLERMCNANGAAIELEDEYMIECGGEFLFFNSPKASAIKPDHVTFHD